MTLNVSSILTDTTIWFVAALCFIVDVRTYGLYGRTDGRTDVRTDRRTFLPGLLGHLSGDDQINTHRAKGQMHFLSSNKQ